MCLRLLCKLFFPECGPLQDPANGVVSHPDGTTLGNVATYTCDTGYYVSQGNVPTRVCESNGVWSNTPVTCVIYGKIN